MDKQPPISLQHEFTALFMIILQGVVHGLGNRAVGEQRTRQMIAWALKKFLD